MFDVDIVPQLWLPVNDDCPVRVYRTKTVKF